MTTPLTNVKIALSMSQLRAGKRLLKGTKVLSRGADKSQVDAFQQLTAFRGQLADENRELIERAGKGTWQRLKTGRKTRLNRRLLGKADSQLKTLNKAKPIKAHVADEAAAVAATAKGEVKGSTGFGANVLGAGGLAGGGFLLGGGGGSQAPIAPGMTPARVPRLSGVR